MGTELAKQEENGGSLDSPHKIIAQILAEAGHLHPVHLATKILTGLGNGGWRLMLDKSPEVFDHPGRSCYNVHPRIEHKDWLTRVTSMKEGFDEGRNPGNGA